VNTLRKGDDVIIIIIIIITIIIIVYVRGLTTDSYEYDYDGLSFEILAKTEYFS
jgi:hypothetical protein